MPNPLTDHLQTTKDDYVLGWSGLPLALECRRGMLKQLEPVEPLTKEEARISQGMDSAAALIREGRVVAAVEEERFVREPHTHNFPVNAIRWCLQKTGITLRDVRTIAHGFNYAPYAKFLSGDPFGRRRYETAYNPNANSVLFASHFPEADVNLPFRPISHHHAHAASAFYESGFEEALVLVMDAMGEYHSTSVFMARGGEISPLRQYDLFSSLGLFYSLVTMHLGFTPNADEYKVMGLAPYGDPTRFLSALEEALEYRPNGTVFFTVYLRNRDLLSRETFRGTRQWLAETFFAPRAPGEELTPDHADLAAALQALLSRAVFYVLSHWRATIKIENLCIAGGVGFNCTLNGEILRSGIVNQIYVPPAAGDAGTAIGAALCDFYGRHPDAPRHRATLPFYGPNPMDADIQAGLANIANGLIPRRLAYDSMVQEVAGLIEQGKVVAWMQGRMEFGPRALGNRSILADPRRADMKDIINRMVKKREQFRPFAPSVKADAAHVYFEIPPGQSHPYMLTTVSVRAPFRTRLPAITHVDGSARLQTVEREHNPLFWQLLDAFEERTGLPVLLNTSFNVAGEAIVCTVEDALKTFIGTDLDALAIGGWLVVKGDAQE